MLRVRLINMRLLCAVMLAVLLPSMAAAQNSGIYIQAGPLLDIRLTSSSDSFPVDARSVIETSTTFTWNDLNGDRIWQPGEEGVPVFGGLQSLESRRSQERFAPGVSVALGVFVAPSVSLRLEGSFSGRPRHHHRSKPAHRCNTGRKPAHRVDHGCPRLRRVAPGPVSESHDHVSRGHGVSPPAR